MDENTKRMQELAKQFFANPDNLEESLDVNLMDILASELPDTHESTLHRIHMLIMEEINNHYE